MQEILVPVVRAEIGQEDGGGSGRHQHDAAEGFGFPEMAQGIPDVLESRDQNLHGNLRRKKILGFAPLL